MKTEWLETILATASECGLAVIGFDELPHAESETVFAGKGCHGE